MDATQMIVNGRVIPIPATVCALVYHTVYNANEYAEGDEYMLNDPELFETLIAIGFVHYEPTP
jgi:hypothetical protein